MPKYQDGLKPFTVTFKTDEKYLCEFAYSHASPSLWVKDLIIREYRKQYSEQVSQMISPPNLQRVIEPTKEETSNTNKFFDYLE